MRVRIRRFTESSASRSALDVPLSRAEDGSNLCTPPTGFTHFVCTVAPLSEGFGLLCSSYELLIVLILSMFSPSQLFLNLTGTMASADSCFLNDTSRYRLPFPAWLQVSPGKNVDFPCALAEFTALAFDCIGLRCQLPTRPTVRPLTRFVFLKSQVCLRLPPDPTSR